ncbi:MAG: gliding motility protein GldL [Candidatus Pacearchaeota archaeon]
MSILVEKKKASSFFYSDGFRKGTAMLYGLGASIVILGALFKILHWPYANEMLIVGMGTEALIFFVSAFEPIPDLDVHYEWEKVYPQLASEEAVSEDLSLENQVVKVTPINTQPAENLNKSLEAINKAFTPDLFESLSLSIKGLNSNVSNLSEIADVAKASKDYSDRLKAASSKIDEMNKSYAITLDSVSALSNSVSVFGTTVNNSVNDIKTYQDQMKALTQNLNSLNAIYETEFKDASAHSKSIKEYYGNLTAVMNNIVETSKEAEALKQEVSALTFNMSRLNRIYGSMLSAMAAASKE